MTVDYWFEEKNKPIMEMIRGIFARNDALMTGTVEERTSKKKKKEPLSLATLECADNVQLV